MLAVHTETGLTGCFRIRRATLQCQVIVTVRKYGHVIERYTSWRVATDDDCFRAWFQARHAKTDLLGERFRRGGYTKGEANDWRNEEDRTERKHGRCT